MSTGKLAPYSFAVTAAADAARAIVAKVMEDRAKLESELAAEREKAERYRLVTLKQDAELADWRYLEIWGGTPEVIHEFIRGQQNRIHHCQDLETELAALRSLLRESLDCIDQYDYEEAFDMVQRIKAALKEAKP